MGRMFCSHVMYSLSNAWSLKGLLCVGLTVTLLFSHHVFHFSSTDGKYWILMKRRIINTTVRLSAKQKAWKKATCCY